MTLKSFPRGGKNLESNFKASNKLCFKQNKIKSKKEKPKKNVDEGKLSDDTPIVLSTAQNLRYSTLQEGMIILGRIFKVTDYHAIVSLPGLVSGKLQVTDISESYTNLLKTIANNESATVEFKSIKDLYKEGDYVVCYVKELNSVTKKVLLSLEPQLINQNLNLNILQKCSKVILTIGSVEDHGYVLETGLKNFRAFLSLKDTDEDSTTFYPGKQIMCAIKDIETVENVFTAKISTKLKHVNTVETYITSLDSLIPKTQFSLVIDKVLKNGLQVSFGENNIGYINQFYLQNALSSYSKGQNVTGTLLYIVPTVKFAYFSLLSLEQTKMSLTIGDIIENAKVIYHDTRGIFMQLKKGIRGFVPLKRTEVDFENIASIFTINSIHKCKIIAYDLIANVYICTMEKKLLNEQHINIVHLQPGDIVDVKIININNNGSIKVSVGKTFGIIPPEQVSDPGSINKLKLEQNVKARVLSTSNKKLFTLKKSLIESKLPILCSIENAKTGSIYDGSVGKITDKGVLVHFFGNVKGWIPKHFLNSQLESQKWNLVLGQTITVVIKKVNVDENRIILALSRNETVCNIKYKIGETVKGTVVDSSVEGVYLRLKNGDEEGPTAFLPASHMSPCYEVGKLLAAKTVAGEILSAIVFSINPNLILSTTFAPEKTYKFNELNSGDIMLCSVKKINKDSIKVLLPVIKYSKYGLVPGSNVGNLESIYMNQILFGKITTINRKTNEINLTTQLSKVWKGLAEHEVKMMTAVDLLSCYLSKISELSKNIYYRSKPISKITIGQRVKGTVESIMDHGLILKLDNNIKGLVCTNNYLGDYKQGDNVEGSVLWVNYPQEYVEITLLSKVVKNISEKQTKLPKIPIGTQMRGEIVLITNWFILVVLKGHAKGTIVALPSRRHMNDFVPDLSPYQLGNKVRCYGVLNKEDTDILLPICMLKSAFEICNPKIEKQKSSQSLKRKMESFEDNKNISGVKKAMKHSNDENIQEQKLLLTKKHKEKLETNSQKNSNKKDKRKNKRKIDSDEESNSEDDEMQIEESSRNQANVNTNSASDLTLKECGFNWNNTVNAETVESSTSESEEEDNDHVKTKKKKLTPAERRELERKKEREIREREEALANCQVPQTADQFDRLILSSPDSSLVWVQYMAYYLQATEIDKARSIARRALKTINFREENERLNVWQALLNLESKFGTLESLNEVFQEAAKQNDAQKIYAHMLTIHADAGRQFELEKITNAMIAKFKHNPETWINCGCALLKVGMKDKSRHIMQRALQSLPANKHVDVIVRFAQLENKFGDKERAHTLFEQVLSSYPKRVDVWGSYVDLLVKSGDIEIARKVLDRGLTQALPAKKMKILFKKYISFEEKNGTPENVANIRKLAVKYVEEQCQKVN